MESKSPERAKRNIPDRVAINEAMDFSGIDALSRELSDVGQAYERSLLDAQGIEDEAMTRRSNQPLLDGTVELILT